MVKEMVKKSEPKEELCKGASEHNFNSFKWFQLFQGREEVKKKKSLLEESCLVKFTLVLNWLLFQPVVENVVENVVVENVVENVVEK